MFNTDGEGGVWFRLHGSGRRYQMPCWQTVVRLTTLGALMALGMIATWHDLHLPE